MQKFLLGLFVAVVALSFASSVSAQTKGAAPAKGVVASVAADSVTVNAGGGKTLTFTVDAKTSIIGRGAGTATKNAKKGGASGAKLVDVVHAGDEVEVKYAEAAGKMVASEVRVTKAATKK